MKKAILVLVSLFMSACSISTRPDGLVCVWEKLSPVGTVSVTAGQVSFVEARLRCTRHVDGFEITVDGKPYAYQSGPYIKLKLAGGYAERTVCINGILSYNSVPSCVIIKVQGDGTCAETPDLKVGDSVRLPSVVKAWAIPRVDPQNVNYITGYEPTTVASGPLCLEGINWYSLKTTLSGKSVTGWVRHAVNGTVYMYLKK